MDDAAFEFFFVSVASDWPDNVELSAINAHQNGLYSVVGLYGISECVSNLYLGEDDELIKRNMSDAIYSALHDAAATYSSIRPVDLPRNIVKEKFEKRLIDAVSMPSLGWDDQDIARVKGLLKKK